MSVLFYTLIVFQLVVPTPTRANTDLIIICDEADCFINTTDSLFDVNAWAPGYSSLATITVDNQREGNCNLLMQTKNEIENPKHFAKEIFASIQKDNRDIYGETIGVAATAKKTMHNVFTSKYVNMGTINSNSSSLYLWTTTFNPEAGNEFQAANTIFDFSLSFKCSETIPEQVVELEQETVTNPASATEDEKQQEFDPTTTQPQIPRVAGASTTVTDTLKYPENDKESVEEKVAKVLGTKAQDYIKANPTKAQRCRDYRAWFLIVLGQAGTYSLSGLLLYPKNTIQYFLYLALAAVITAILKNTIC